MEAHNGCLSGSKRYWNPNRKIRNPHCRSNPKLTRQLFLTKIGTKCQKTETPQTAMNTESQKPNFFGTKTDIENTKKSQCPGPSRMNRTVQSTNHTNDNTKTIIIAETSTKTFLKIFLVFQSETCCETTLVTRYFFREGVMSRNRIIHRLRISMLDTL